ncbi:hypothetical protein HMPREF1246_1249 [Acidaminococcus sp. BV3L6]|nr:hypothetical protein HMPREF1246_1249 [Acidaminococcus sp. BV3L6]
MTDFHGNLLSFVVYTSYWMVGFLSSMIFCNKKAATKVTA